MLSVDQIFALSPDDSSSKAAKGLLAPGKWPVLGFDEASIWGHCQGSGSKPYQVIIDCAGPTFKCSCPSRKFPCKHGLALYLLRVQKEGSFAQGNAPVWVMEWMEGRKQRAEKKAEKEQAQIEGKAETVADPEAAAKRVAKRMERMVGGAKDLQRWMGDIVRHGMADLPSKPVTFWREISARMVDAQATGLGYALRGIEDAVHGGEQWAALTLAEMGRVQLLLEAMQRMETLPEAVQSDVRGAAGWPMEKEDVLKSGERLEDAWLVEGVSFDENEKLWERRVWLRGAKSERRAMVLDFSHGQRRFERSFVAGAAMTGTVVYFPSASPLRALALTLEDLKGGSGNVNVGEGSWQEALATVAEVLAVNPWAQRLPVGLNEMTPVRKDGKWWARDDVGREMRMRVSEEDGWLLLALSGGKPLRVFGEWRQRYWRPLTAWEHGAADVCWTESYAAQVD